MCEEEKKINECKKLPNWMLRQVKGLKTDSKEVVGVEVMENCVPVRRKVVVLKDYMERIMNEENEWDANAK